MLNLFHKNSNTLQVNTILYNPYSFVYFYESVLFNINKMRNFNEIFMNIIYFFDFFKGIFFSINSKSSSSKAVE